MEEAKCVHEALLFSSLYCCRMDNGTFGIFFEHSCNDCPYYEAEEPEEETA